MSKGKKGVALVVFLVGLIACTSAMTKLAYSILLTESTNSGGIIAGCLPACLSSAGVWG
ncbi:hypothetical protein BDV12DRAFT_48548 [Aspergillus spectabilis]